MKKNINLRIKNYSLYLSDDEITKCLNLLPSKYKSLNNKVFIFKSFTDYIFYCLKHLMFISAYAAIIKLIVFKLNKAPLMGNYSFVTKKIYLFENCFIDMINSPLNNLHLCNNYQLYSDYIDKLDLAEYRRGWTAFVLIDAIIHELTHALQYKEKKLSNPLKYAFAKWEDIPEEIDAVSASINIISKNSNEFLEILNTNGIAINHTLKPLEIKYKYRITIT